MNRRAVYIAPERKVKGNAKSKTAAFEGTDLESPRT